MKKVEARQELNLSRKEREGGRKKCISFLDQDHQPHQLLVKIISPGASAKHCIHKDPLSLVLVFLDVGLIRTRGDRR